MTIPHQTLETLTQLREQRATLEQALTQCDAARDHTIRDALRAGATITQLAQATGLSRQTIYAIRDRT